MVILLMVIGLGFFGGAEDLTSEDIIIGDAEKLVETGEVDNVSQVDFDTNSLLYQPNFEDFETPQTNFQGYIWDGQGSNGTITYDVSNESEAVIVSRNPGLIPGINLDNLYILKDGIKEQVTTTSYGVDLSNTNELVIVLTSQDAEFLGFEGITDLQLEDAVSSRNIDQISYNVEESFFDQATNLIGYSLVGVAEIFATLKAWFDFVWVIPGIVGWFLKGYIGIVFAYFLVKEVWLG